MIKTISSLDIKDDTKVDLVCSYCGKEHGARSVNGNLFAKEGTDFVFETNGDETWCICVSCQEEME